MNGLIKFLAGVAVGATAVALFTPTTGDELRAKILELLRRKGIVAQDNVDEIVSMISAELDENK